MKRVLPVRIPVFIDTKLVTQRKSYDGIIGNLSRQGVFVETHPTRAVNPFLPRKRLDVTFQTDTKKTITLHCEVIWLYSKRNEPDSVINSLGLEIIHSSTAYHKFLENL